MSVEFCESTIYLDRKIQTLCLRCLALLKLPRYFKYPKFPTDNGIEIFDVTRQLGQTQLGGPMSDDSPFTTGSSLTN
jgi:hypothetical protein